MTKPILCLDFDGVIHSYASGWQGPRTISDPPVPGALEFISKALDTFDVHIYSSRSKYWFGRWAMKRWLYRQYCYLLMSMGDVPVTSWEWQLVVPSMDPWDETVKDSAKTIVNRIYWPRSKPPALVTLDDRAIKFTGQFPSMDELTSFQPWNKAA